MHTFRKYLAVFVLAGSAVFSYVLFVRAQDAATTASISFPVLELGNCASKEECKQYCDSPENVEVCATFAEERGLMSKKEAAQARKFGATVKRGEGPGGCRGPEECNTFCSNLENLEVCMKFAEEQGIKDEHVEEGRKILEYRRAGGAMPGGCTSEQTCKEYCSDFSHAEECFLFAKKAGILQSRGRAGAPPGRPGLRPVEPEEELDEIQFEKLMELAKAGKTPGGCTSREQCEAYCEDAEHLEECVSFGEQVGFIEKEQAKKIREIGGKGPGGCSSPRACEAYCNVPERQEECFKFAEEHGFIPKEEIEQAKEGMVRLRAGLEQAPDEVKACLRSSLGENIIVDIEAGKLLPGPAIGERVRACFEEFGRGGGPEEMFEDAPREVRSCLKEKLGGDFEKVKSGKTMPTPEMADTLRVCFEKMRFERGGPEQGGEGMVGGPPGADFLRSAPPGVAQCLKEKTGGDVAGMQGGQMSEEVRENIRACFEEFRPSGMGGDARAREGPGGCKSPEECRTYCEDSSHRDECTGLKGNGMMQGSPPAHAGEPASGDARAQGIPPEVMDCARAVFGEDPAKIQRNEMTAEEREKVSACVRGKMSAPVGGMGPVPEEGGAPLRQFGPQFSASGTRPSPQLGPQEALPPGGDQYQNYPRQQFDQQYQQQFQQQFEQQYQQYQNQAVPPAGAPAPIYQLPSGGQLPPPPTGDQSAPPPSGELMPPPAGNIFEVFQWLVKSLLPRG